MPARLAAPPISGFYANTSAGVLIGDLAELDDIHQLGEQANTIGRFDAVIHNAGIYVDAARTPTRAGHARVLAMSTCSRRTSSPA